MANDFVLEILAVDLFLDNLYRISFYVHNDHFSHGKENQLAIYHASVGIAQFYAKTTTHTALVAKGFSWFQLSLWILKNPKLWHEQANDLIHGVQFQRYGKFFWMLLYIATLPCFCMSDMAHVN